MPPYIEMPPVCLDAAIYLDAHSVCLNAPICLDGPLYVWMPLYIWVPPILTPLCMFGCPHMFGHPLYVWMSSIGLAVPCMFGCPQMYGASKGMRDIQTYMGVQTYRRHPNVWGAYGYTVSLTKHAFFLLYM